MRDAASGMVITGWSRGEGNFRPADQVVYSLAAATAFVVAVLAGLPSARRAAAVQPIVAMRSE